MAYFPAHVNAMQIKFWPHVIIARCRLCDARWRFVGWMFSSGFDAPITREPWLGEKAN